MCFAAGLGPWKITDKTALGHESGGIVLAIGEGVTNVQAGDRVAIEPGVPCGKATCHFCPNRRRVAGKATSILPLWNHQSSFSSASQSLAS